MTITTLIFLACFLGVACLIGGLATLLSRDGGGSSVEDRLDALTGTGTAAAKKSNEPSLLQSPLNDVPNVMEEFVKRFFNLRSFLQQADTQLTPANFIALSLAFGIGTTLILPLVRVPLAAAPAGVIMGIIPFLALYFK